MPDDILDDPGIDSPIPFTPVAQLALGARTGGPLAELFKAKAKARAGFGAIQRTREVTVRTKDGRSYAFKYAPLDTVLDACLPALAAQGLDLCWLMQPADAGGATLTCLLTHASGAFVAMDMLLPPVGGPQERGSQITYGRRYQAQCILGVASEEDDDGNAAAGNDAQVSERAPAKRPNDKPQPVKLQEVGRSARQAEAPREAPKQQQDLAPALAASLAEGVKRAVELEAEARRKSEPPDPGPQPPPPDDSQAPAEPHYEVMTDSQKKRLRELVGVDGLKMPGKLVGDEAKRITGKDISSLNSADGDKLIAAFEARLKAAR
jgi:hypothetical protein